MAKSITIRVEDSLFEELDNARHARKTTFQEVGLAFFQQWLMAGAVPESPSPHPLSAEGEQIVKLIAGMEPERRKAVLTIIHELSGNAAPTGATSAAATGATSPPEPQKPRGTRRAS